jgi:hypothetical protein
VFQLSVADREPAAGAQREAVRVSQPLRKELRADMDEVGVGRAERVARDPPPVAVDVDDLAREALLVVDTQRVRIDDRRVCAIAGPDPERPVGR